jgi:(1->4)-alpha-D-glucan 1-alpha-D-glucosylmutase
MCAYMTKALREAKLHTSWLSPDNPYEQAVERFVRAILDPRRGEAFQRAFLPFAERVAELGIYNALAQLLIKITAPGIPDFYQGTELWDLHLVDPDNRRPVDYPRRRQLLEQLACRRDGDDRTLASDLLEQRHDGRIKMFVMARGLCARRQMPDVFTGEYLPLETIGDRRESVFAFARRHQSGFAVTCVPRLLAQVASHPAPPLGPVWGDTRIELPSGAPPTFRNVLTGALVDTEPAEQGSTIRVAALLDCLPLALLTAR